MIKADENGVVRGSFTVPANMPVGTKDVEFIGRDGSYGSAHYTGRNTIETRELRRITTITTLRSDPLAQTFTLDSGRHIAALDLWFRQKGDSQVRVQIRETQLGIPNQTVLAEASLEPSQINLSGTATRFEFQPVYLNAGQEYALVLLTDDGVHEVAIAELGKYDASHGWVTSQPYQVGVLLSSSNAQTWTPHQDRDLSFTLHAARFTQSVQEVDLGEVDADQVTDIMPMAGVERPDSDTDLRFFVEDESGARHIALDSAPLNLAQKLSGKVRVSAELRGSVSRSPVLYPGVQLATGKLAQSGEYITRAIAAGDDTQISVRFEANLPGPAARVSVLAEIAGDWVELNIVSDTEVGDGFGEKLYRLDNLNTDKVRVKLVLEGNESDRPRVRALRVLTT